MIILGSLLSKVNSVLNNKTVNNAKWMIGEQAVQMAISVVLGVITARYLGPSNYGVINYSAAFVVFFSSIVTLGLEGVIIKEMVNNRDQEGTIIGTGIAMRLLASAISIFAILILLTILNPGDTIVLKVGFLQSLVMLFKAFELIDFWFQSYLRSKYVAILKSISYFLVAIYKFYILFTNKSIEWFAFSTSLDFLLIAIMIVIAYYKKGGKQMHFSFEMAKKLLKQSYHFILSGMLITVYVQMDKILIGQFLTEADVGLYSAATTICNYWLLVPVALINSARPTIMQLKKDENEEMYLKRIKQLYCILIWGGAIVCLGISVLSKFILSTLYQEAYISATPTLAIVIWYTIFSTLGTARGIWIVCENKNAYIKKIVLWGTVMNLVLNLALIPVLGIIGSAITSLTTQIFTAIIAPMLYKETRIHSKYILDAFLFRIK